ncbi:cache domain-containing protein [Labilibaculum sp.]|uniref:cache domain-containing protein n=1 Tax=Labilibaculum sp. TaxID=2060723 RepID=UPI002AA7A211|nr:cache domain-containing protein [Labilibaculum sp.]
MKFILAKIIEDKSISKVFLVSLLATSFLLVSILGIFWVQQARQKFKQESKQIQDDFFKIQEKTLQHETQTLINYIENERVQTRNTLKKDISSRVYEAHSIATNIYNSCKNNLTEDQIKKLITDALRTVRFNDGSGFFYINSLAGIVEMDPENPKWEGQNKLSLKDVFGVPIIKNEIEIAVNQGEGYSNYSWQKEEGQKIDPKISFVKIFKPYNWYIGCTQYVENYQLKIQNKILDKITEMRFDESFTIAVFNFNGTCLAHTQKDLIGQNLWNKKDRNGKKIVQELITRGTDKDGGFVRYMDPYKEGSRESIAKLIYAKTYKDWQWVIGSGVHISQLTESIQNKKDELKVLVNGYFIKAGLIFLLTIFIIITFTRFMVKISKSGLEILTQFYKNAASDSHIIDISKLHFKEFKILGEHANEMILKRKSIEHQLNIETAYFEQLFENSPEAIAITDNESNGIKINKQFTSLFGYTKEDLKGVVIDTLLADETRQDEANNLNYITAKGQLVEIETVRKCKDGRLIDVSIMGNPIEVDGEQIAIFGIYRDITERKIYEKHLTEAKNKAEESDKLKSAFLANMSHEIRTPMNHILGFTEIITSQEVNESERLEYGALIKQSGINLLQLINNIIDLSKIECKQIKLTSFETPVNSLLSELYEKYYIHKNKNKKSHLILKIQKTLNDKDSIIYTDPYRLEQLLSNLIENAIKFTDNGFIEFGYHLKEKNKIEFFVKDTGIGIPEQSIGNIFRSFRQMDGSDTRQYGGTGLGLTISNRLAELLGGDIRVESKENAGTCFFVTLPYNREKLKIKKSAIYEKTDYNWKGKSILIVDDEKINFSFFKASLANTKAEILWATNGSEAVTICQSIAIDLVLMDIQMPIMNGYDATKEIKSFNSQIPIIGQTAYFQKEYKQKVMAAGCDDYLSKPIKTAKLLDSIEKQFLKN